MATGDDEAAVPAAEFPAKGSNGSGSSRAYRVQARYMNDGGSRIINGIALGPKWVTLEFDKSPVGVPTGNPSFIRPCSSLLSYASAQALRWWFLANAGGEYGLGGLCVQTRLVRYEETFTYAETAVAAEEATDSRGRPIKEGD